MKNLKIGDKLTSFPLIQGGMGVGISLGRLAGSVAKEGGIGIISTAQIGYREKDFDRNPAEANQRAILSEMKKARAISPDGIIGYNIMVALKEYASHVKAAIQAGADLIISGAGLPTELPALVSGSSTKIAPIVSTDKSAKVISPEMHGLFFYNSYPDIFITLLLHTLWHFSQGALLLRHFLSALQKPLQRYAHFPECTF